MRALFLGIVFTLSACAGSSDQVGTSFRAEVPLEGRMIYNLD